MLSKEQIQIALPDICYPEELPVSLRREEIKHLIDTHQVVIVCGETGSGKTTQLPKMCLELGRGCSGQAIVHTQPRRLAATATAKRIASELRSEIGQWVGFKIRFQDHSSEKTAIKLVTDGILLAESQTDPLFTRYDTIIIDEAHERSLNIDFLLGYLKGVLGKRPDLKLIVTSATIDAERFAQHFCNSAGQAAPIIEVSGRLYPIEIRYKDPVQTEPEEVDEDAFNAATLDAVEELCREGGGDILMFLPGEREIREMSQFLAKNVSGIEILPLFARLTAQEQERIFKPSGRRRIVLSTNVAETSLTVPGIRYVIDSGVARVNRYSYRNKVEMLQTERISKASANQRAGRCGRVANGVCIRLYSEQDFQGRADFTDPEILRSSLASVILRMKSLHLAQQVEEFPFLQKPLGRAIADGYQLLSELNALDEQGELTKIGKALARLPLDPRIARMLFEASHRACLREMLVIAAVLAIQDPRERPYDAQEAADNAHQQFQHPDSDFMFFLKLWDFYSEQKNKASSNKEMRNTLARKFLNANRMREWVEVHQQLSNMVKEHHWRINASPAEFEQIHLSLMAGLLGNIGLKHETEPVFLGARSIRFSVHPGSFLFKKPGKWVMAAELIETTRLYARSVAKIQPEWLEKVGAHLIRRNHSNPHWEKSSGQAVAMEMGGIYGLPIYSQRRVSLAKLDPDKARELMILEGLVPGQINTQLPFYVHNRKLIEDLEKLEHKTRRQDILVDDTLIAQFYDKRLPQTVVNLQTLEHWAKHASKEELHVLLLNKDDLLNKRADGITTEFYPKKLNMNGLSFDLTYHFEPGSPRDGATVTIPLLLLNQVSPLRVEWLVPGMLKEKVHLLLKSLPQKLRRHCVPLPQFAERFVEHHSNPTQYDKPLLESVRDFVSAQTPARPVLSDFRIETLAPHHFMNFKLVDEHGRQLDMQRSLSVLKAEWGKKAQETFKKSAAAVVEQVREPAKASNAPLLQREPVTSWSFGSLPDMLEIQRGEHTFFGYPALKDMGEHCVLEVYDEEGAARTVHREGVLRLFTIALKDPLKYLHKNLLDFQKIAMLYMPLGSSEELRAQWLELAILRSTLAAGLPTDKAQFNAKVQEGKSRLNLISQEIGRLLINILTEYGKLIKKLQAEAKSFPEATKDIQAQLQWLMPKDFLLKRPWEQLHHYPRYLKAVYIRLERLRNGADRDKEMMKELLDLQMQWMRASSQLKGLEEESLNQFAWQLQELRVSLFAQELRTPMPVSVKRLQKAWEAISKRH